MNNNSTTVVAIDFGSSYIKGAVAVRSDDGKINIIANSEVRSEDCIRCGKIFNLETTAQKVDSLIKKLEALSRKKISRVYTSIGGQSLHTVKYVASHVLNPAREIVKEDIDSLDQQVLGAVHEGYELLKIEKPEYFVNGQYTTNPVGINAMKIDASYKIIFARPQLKANIVNVLTQKLNYEIADIFISPLILADTFLSEDNKKLGCALIDFGGGSTTISVYKKGVLSGIRVIPLGSDNITLDLTALHITNNEAERVKCQQGSCFVNFADKAEVEVNTRDKLTTKTLSKIEINRYIEARAKEIVDNVKHQLWKMIDKEALGSIIFITGSGSLLKDFQEMLSNALGTSVEASVSFGYLDSTNKVYIDKPGLNLLYSIIQNATEDCCVDTPTIQKVESPSILPKEETLDTTSGTTTETNVSETSAHYSEKERNENVSKSTKDEVLETQSSYSADHDLSGSTEQSHSHSEEKHETVQQEKKVKNKKFSILEKLKGLANIMLTPDEEDPNED